MIVQERNLQRVVYETLFYLLLINVIAGCLFIPLVAVTSSLQSESQVLSVPAEFIPRPVQFDNYIKIWKETPLLILIRNGLIVTGSSILLVLLIAIPAAFSLAKLKVPKKKLLMMSILLTQMFSPVVVLVPLFNTFQKLHLINTYSGLIIIDSAFSLAFSTLLLTSFFENIPPEVTDAALLDGCGHIQTITKVILPISAPGIFVVTIYIFTNVWNEFLFAFTFISSSDKFTPIVGLFTLIQRPGQMIPPWHLAMAMSVIISLPVILLFYFRKSDMVEGLSAGAIK